MTLSKNLIVISLVVALGLISSHANAEINTSEITKICRKDLQKIKILSSSVDKVHLYLTHASKRVFKISSLTGDEAKSLLNSLKSDKSLELKSTIDAKASYQNVEEWSEIKI